jgi:hypothetical protein
MIIIRNNIIPPKGFKTVNLFGVWFVRKDAVLTYKSPNHERIHTRQIFELMTVGIVLGFLWTITLGWSWWLLMACLPLFYWWYLIEWFIRLFFYEKAYRNISLEREAYANDTNLDYLKNRKLYSWFKYL